MRTLLAYPAYATLPARVREILDVDYDPTLPLFLALGVLTGLPGYGLNAAPVIATACDTGLALWDLDGYYVAGYLPRIPGLRALGANAETANYGGAVTLLAALPTRLTYTALRAVGFDFEFTGPSDGASLPVLKPGYALGVTPNGEKFTVTATRSGANGDSTPAQLALGTYLTRLNAPVPV